MLIKLFRQSILTFNPLNFYKGFPQLLFWETSLNVIKEDLFQSSKQEKIKLKYKVWPAYTNVAKAFLTTFGSRRIWI
jgi:hypothetical protein